VFGILEIVVNFIRVTCILYVGLIEILALGTGRLCHATFLNNSTFLLCRHMLLLSRFIYFWVVSSVNPCTDL